MMVEINNFTLHLFKRPCVGDYQKKLAYLIGLPDNVIGKVDYSIKWVDQEVIDNISTINENNGIDSILWVVDCNKVNDDPNSEDFSFKSCFALRTFRINRIERSPDDLKITLHFTTKEFFSDLRIINDLIILKSNLCFDFDTSLHSSPCKEKGFAILGPKYAIDSQGLTKNPSLSTIYNHMQNILNLPKFANDPKMCDYPLVHIHAIQEIKGERNEIIPNENGAFELLTKKSYNIYFSYFQGDHNRMRTFYINQKKYSNKEANGEIIALSDLKETMINISLVVQMQSIEYLIPIEIKVNKIWYQYKPTLIALLIVIAAVIIVPAIYIIPPTYSNILVGIISAVVVMVAGKIYDVIKSEDE